MSDRIRVLLALGTIMVVLASAGLSTRWWLGSEAPTEEEPAAPVETATPPAPEPPTERLQTVTIRKGDSLVVALTRAGLELRVGHDVASALARAGVDLRRLKPGDTVEITWSGTDKPLAVSLQPTPWLGYAAVAEEDGWTVKRLETTPDVRLAVVQGRVERSLFEAVEQAGESPQLVLAVVNVFEWDFDFTADTRSGDRFRLMVEKRYAGDTFVSYGRVLAAQYVTDRRTLTGIGYSPGRERFGYYDLDGRSLKKSFLKSPLEFSRITSRFTYARPHPILGGTLPHLAVDYAAPTGTPVRAVGDGVVSRAGRDGGYGIAVRIRHRSGYETLYAHLSRLGAGIQPGARVSQRQIIGFVGSTGMSTGPHLHYEVIKGGQRVNPLGERFIPGEPIPGSERGAFEGHARELITRLESDATFEVGGVAPSRAETGPAKPDL